MMLRPHTRRLAALGALLAITLAACDSGEPDGGGGTGTVDFAPAGPPLLTSATGNGPSDILLEARGDIVVGTQFYSTDGGRSWRRFSGGGASAAFFIDDAAAYLQMSELVRFDFTTGTAQVIGAPAGGKPGYRPSDGTLFSYVHGETRLYRYRGGAWTSAAGPISSSTGVYEFGVAPGGGLFLLTTQGLVASTDDGATWTTRPIPDITGSTPTMRTYDGGVLLYGADDEAFYRSSDAGQTFEAVALPAGENTRDLRVAEGGVLLLARHRSDDGGRTWSVFIDYDALGVVFSSNDVVTFTQGRYYVWFERLGFFRAEAPLQRLEYVHGFALPDRPQQTAAVQPLGGVPLAGGGAIVEHARYDAAAGAWLRVREAGRPYRLRDGRIALHQGRTVQFSTDEGRTFGPAQTVWTEPAFFGFRVNSIGPLVQTADGALYATTRWIIAAATTGTTYTALAVSRDGGTTWTAAALEGSVSADPFVLVAAGNTLYGYRTRSRDGGATWEPSPAGKPLADLPGGGVLFLPFDASATNLQILETDGQTVRDAGAFTAGGQAVSRIPLDAEGALLHVDAEGYAYANCGLPYLQACRSARPIR